jgi:hypothetical protein
MAAVAVAGIASASTSGGGPSTTPAAPAQAGTTISQFEAEGIAVTLVPGSEVVESNLDTDRDRPVWNVHLSTRSGQVEVKVDAETGAARVDADADRDGNDDGTGHDAGDDHDGDGSNRGSGGGDNSGRH